MFYGNVRRIRARTHHPKWYKVRRGADHRREGGIGGGMEGFERGK